MDDAAEAGGTWIVPRFDGDEEGPTPEDASGSDSVEGLPEGSIAAMIAPRMMMIRYARPMRSAYQSYVNEVLPQAASRVWLMPASISAALASTSRTMCWIMSASWTWWSVTPDR